MQCQLLRNHLYCAETRKQNHNTAYHLLFILHRNIILLFTDSAHHVPVLHGGEACFLLELAHKILGIGITALTGDFRNA